MSINNDSQDRSKLPQNMIVIDEVYDKSKNEVDPRVIDLIDSKKRKGGGIMILKSDTSHLKDLD